jgi:hypothetical protein
MRIAVLVIGLMLTIGLFIQAFVIAGLSDMANDEDTGAAAAIGILMALMWLVSCGLVLPLPRVSMILFIIAGALGFLAASDYPDLAFWGGISLVLALFSYFGYRGKRTSDARQEEQAALVRQASLLMGLQVAGGAPAQFAPQPIASHITCPQCGGDVPLSAQFCPSCGLKRYNPPATQ